MPSIVSFTEDLALQSQLLMDVLLPEVVYFDAFVGSQDRLRSNTFKAGVLLKGLCHDIWGILNIEKFNFQLKETWKQCFAKVDKLKKKIMINHKEQGLL